MSMHMKLIGQFAELVKVIYKQGGCDITRCCIHYLKNQVVRARAGFSGYKRPWNHFRFFGTLIGLVGIWLHLQASTSDLRGPGWLNAIWLQCPKWLLEIQDSWSRLVSL